MEVKPKPERLAKVKRSHAVQPAIVVLRPVRRALRSALAQMNRQVRYVWWRRLLGRPPIPPSKEFKSNTILEYARNFGTRTLVETGTYLGETIDACLGHFDHIWSIELDPALFQAAVRRFRPWPHVTIVNGDSQHVLPGVLAEVDSPILFWLDAHYSGGITARGVSDTPIGHELTAILDRSSSDDVILIDDARDFGHGDYPGIDAIAELIASRRPGWRFEVRDDIMRAHAAPERPGSGRGGSSSGPKQVQVTVQYHYVMSLAKGLLRIFPPAYNVARRANDFVTRMILAPRRSRLQIAAWRHAGSAPPPPPPFKQRVVRQYAHRFALRVFIETGTYLGDMIEAQRRMFGRVWSIELDPSLYEAAVRRFSTRRNVTVLKGDSGELLPALIGGICEPCLFWLDAHYSAGITARGNLDTPIARELEAILGHPAEHVVLIDDARSFGFGDYPEIDELRRLVSARRPDWTVIVKDDIIRIHHSTR